MRKCANCWNKERHLLSLILTYLLLSNQSFQWEQLEKLIKKEYVRCHQKNMNAARAWRTNIHTKMKCRIGSWRFVSTWGIFHFLNYGQEVKKIRNFSSFMDLGRKCYVQGWPGRKKTKKQTTQLSAIISKGYTCGLRKKISF